MYILHRALKGYNHSSPAQRPGQIPQPRPALSKTKLTSFVFFCYFFVYCVSLTWMRDLSLKEIVSTNIYSKT